MLSRTYENFMHTLNSPKPNEQEINSPKPNEQEKTNVPFTESDGEGGHLTQDIYDYDPVLEQNKCIFGDPVLEQELNKYVFGQHTLSHKGVGIMSKYNKKTSQGAGSLGPVGIGDMGKPLGIGEMGKKAPPQFGNVGEMLDSGESLIEAFDIYADKKIIKPAKRMNSCGTIARQEGLKAPTTPSEIEDLDWLKDSLRIYISQEPIIVYAISIDKEQRESNQTTSIRCYGGVAFGGYAHDMAKDSYLVQCVDCLQLGNLSFSYVITIPSAGEWKTKIPSPEKILEKYFSPEQRKLLENYREKYKSPRYEVQFIQMLGCHF